METKRQNAIDVVRDPVIFPKEYVDLISDPKAWIQTHRVYEKFKFNVKQMGGKALISQA